jgi:branched-chain amino acid transport system permease protein
VAEDTETARVMGINFGRIIPLTFALGSITAGFAGMIYALYYRRSITAWACCWP